MSTVWLADALRTPVAKRDGALAHLQAWELAAPLIDSLSQRNKLPKADIDYVILGNALYGGGNPARLAALQAQLPESRPALTIDSQCCAGMDAITLGAHMIRSGAAQRVIAGGAESWSRAPQRISNPLNAAAQAYQRPPFTPWPERDPDMLQAAAALAQDRGISRLSQEAYAINSHRKARAHPAQAGLMPIDGQLQDSHNRNLNERLCARLPALAGHTATALCAATVATQSDAAALVLLCSEQALHTLEPAHHPIEVRGARAGGGDPSQPALAPIAVAQTLLAEQQLLASDLSSIHIMEAFAVQAMVFIEALSADAERCNPQGGALARGHPIGASGAIEVLSAFHALQQASGPAHSLAAIAAAGGLGSALLLARP